MVIAMKQLSLFAMGKEKNTFSDICDRLGCDNNIPAWPDFFGRAIKNYLLDHHIENIHTLSLFSGAGGLDIGFSDVGFEIVESVDSASQDLFRRDSPDPFSPAACRNNPQSPPQSQPHR